MASERDKAIRSDRIALANALGGSMSPPRHQSPRTSSWTRPVPFDEPRTHSPATGHSCILDGDVADLSFVQAKGDHHG